MNDDMKENLAKLEELKEYIEDLQVDAMNWRTLLSMIQDFAFKIHRSYKDDPPPPNFNGDRIEMLVRAGQMLLSAQATIVQLREIRYAEPNATDLRKRLMEEIAGVAKLIMIVAFKEGAL